MFPKPGNAFAQAKALDRQHKEKEAALAGSEFDRLSTCTSADGTISYPPQPRDSQGDHRRKHTSATRLPHSADSTATTFDMFTGDLLNDISVVKCRSPNKPNSLNSLDKRSITDPDHYDFERKSALPEPLFPSKSKGGLFSKLTSKNKANAQRVSLSPPKAATEKEEDLNGPELTKPVIPVTKTIKSDQSSYRSRSSSQSSKVSSRSNPKVDPVNAIHDSHDTRFAFGPASRSSNQTLETPMSKYFTPEKSEGLTLGNASSNPTRDGKYAKMKHAEIVEKTRIPSLSASVISATPVTSPALWVGPDGRVYSGPSLQPLTYQPPNPFDREHLEKRSFKHPSSILSGQWSNSTESMFSATAYTVPGGGAWEQMQIQYPNTMPLLSPADSLKHDSGSSVYSERLSQLGLVRESPEESDSELGPLLETSDCENEATPRNLSQSKIQQLHTTPSKVRSSSGLSKVTEELHEDEDRRSEKSEYLISLDGDSQLSSDKQSTPPVSIYGRFAPTPPYPGYQNRTTIEQFISQQFANLEHKLDRQFENLHNRIDVSRDYVVDKVLNQLTDINAKQQELLNEQHETLKVASELPEQIELLAQESKKDFDQVEKSCLRTEQKIRVDINKTASDIRDINNQLRATISEISLETKTDSSPKKNRSPLRRQVSASVLEKSTMTSSSPSGSPFKKFTKHRKVTPMPGTNTTLSGSPQSIMHAQSRLTETPPHVPVKSTDIGIASTKDLSPLVQQPPTGLRHAAKSFDPTEPIKKPPPTPSRANMLLYPPASRGPSGGEHVHHRLHPSFNNKTVTFATDQNGEVTAAAAAAAAADRAKPAAKGPLKHKKDRSVQGSHNTSENTTKDNEKNGNNAAAAAATRKPSIATIDENSTLSVDRTSGSNNSADDGVWTGGKWYDRVYGTD